MIILMAINLYVSRQVLAILGVIDYGIYNVVGGVVAMVSFLNSTLSSSSQRFFSIEIARKNFDKLKELFSLNLIMFMIIAAAGIVIAETIGLWFVNYKMTVPPERLQATNIVYQISIVTLIFQMIRIPYDGLIIAHEKMSAYAYFSIIEAVGKLSIVTILTFICYDKLVIYGLLTLTVTTLVTLLYIIYCHVKFRESHYKFFWDFQRIKELVCFSGWHILGSTSSTIRSYGINLLINVFFNPAINGARAIAYQVSGTIQQLANNFFIAVKPQIYKSYSENNISGMVNLVMQSTSVCVFLLSIVIIPILVRTEYILDLWLKDVPEYAVIFTQLVLINAMAEGTAGPSIASVLATGKIKRFEIIVSTINLCNLPISYILLRFGFPPQVTMITAIVISFTLIFVRCYMMTKLIDISISKYSKLIVKIISCNALAFIVCKNIAALLPETFKGFLIVLILSAIILTTSYYIAILNKEERKLVIEYILLINKAKRHF